MPNHSRWRFTSASVGYVTASVGCTDHTEYEVNFI